MSSANSYFKVLFALLVFTAIGIVVLTRILSIVYEGSNTASWMGWGGGGAQGPSPWALSGGKAFMIWGYSADLKGSHGKKGYGFLRK